MIGGRGNERVKRRGGKDGIEGRGKEGVLRLTGKEGLKGRGKYRRTGEVNKSAESTKRRGRRRERVKVG